MSEQLALKIPALTDLADGTFGVIASRPGGGKTTFSAWTAFSKALQGEKIVFLSFEYADDEIYERLVQFADTHGSDVKEIMENLFFKSVVLSNTEALKVFLKSTIEAEKPSLVIIDDSFQVFDSRENISTILKSIALNSETSIFYTTHLTRASNSQIIGSSELVADADFVLTLEIGEDADGALRETKIRVVKNRNGALAEITSLVDYKASSFYEAA